MTEESQDVEVETSKNPTKWDQSLDNAYSLLAYSYRNDPDGMSANDLRKMLKLQMLKETLVGKQYQEKIKNLEQEMKGKRRSRRGEDSDEEDEGSNRSRSEDQGDEMAFRAATRKTRTYRRSSSEAGSEVDLEEKINQLVQDKFFNLLDQEKAQPNMGMVAPPRTGTRTRLDDRGERSFKNQGKNVFFGSRTSKSHSLAYLLKIHSRISEDSQLTSEASIELLERFLTSEAFESVDNLKNAGMRIEMIYKTIQTAYDDRVSPYKAGKMLENFLDSPSLIDLGRVSMHIHSLASNIHARESPETRPQSINVTSITALNTYLAKFYPRNEVTKLRKTHLSWTDRNKPKNPLESFFYLSNIAQTALEGLLPSHALGRRAPEGARARPELARVQEVAETPKYQDQDEAESCYGDLDQDDHPDPEWDSASVMALNTSEARPRFRCLLCNQDRHSNGAGGFYRACNIYPNMTPDRAIQPCCGGKHGKLGPGMSCKSPMAKQIANPEQKDSKVLVYR